ncbi:MAG TPA: hypothetical protein VF669_13220 [Tepidisphaeraceae bacterium]|jgi:ACT domain-containing protein
MSEKRFTIDIVLNDAAAELLEAVEHLRRVSAVLCNCKSESGGEREKLYQKLEDVARNLAEDVWIQVLDELTLDGTYDLYQPNEAYPAATTQRGNRTRGRGAA